MKNKINLLKALAIMLVVSGHLEFSLIPIFPPYSFQLALFFFISGMLFNEKYNFIEFVKRRFNSLLKRYSAPCRKILGNEHKLVQRTHHPVLNRASTGFNLSFVVCSSIIHYPYRVSHPQQAKIKNSCILYTDYPSCLSWQI